MATLTSLISLAISIFPYLLYLIGDPPLWINVPKAVGVKNAGTPAPPARIRSARVPWVEAERERERERGIERERN